MNEQMKLSEAIREGAKLRPQGFGKCFTDNSDGVMCSCALGAAYEVLFGLPVKSGIFGWTVRANVLQNAYPQLHSPIGGREADSLIYKIINLNDGEKKTREQIADWLEEKGY